VNELFEYVVRFTQPYTHIRLHVWLARIEEALGKVQEREMHLRTHQDGTQDGLQGEVHDPRLQMSEVHNGEGN
jgi:hypothetical protein